MRHNSARGKNTRLALLSLTAVTALALAGCASGSGAETDGEITIKMGKLLPLTGDFVSAGEKPNEAFELTLENLREQYDGRLNIEVEEFDQGATAQSAVTAYQQAVSWGADVTVSIGGSSTLGLAQAEAAKGTLQLGNYAASLKTVNPLGFNMLALALEHQYPQGIEMLWDQIGDELTSAVYVSADNYQLGQTGTEDWREYLEDKGVETLAVEQVPGSEANLSILGQKLTDLKPSIVVADMPVANTIALATALSNAGYTGELFGGATQASGTLLVNAPNLFDGAYAMQSWSVEQPELTETAQKFIADYEAAYPNSGPPDTFESGLHDGLSAYAFAVDKLGTTDDEQIAEQLRGEGPEGVTMEKISFGDVQALNTTMLLIQIQDNVAQIVRTADE